MSAPVEDVEVEVNDDHPTQPQDASQKADRNRIIHLVVHSILLAIVTLLEIFIGWTLFTSLWVKISMVIIIILFLILSITAIVLKNEYFLFTVSSSLPFFFPSEIKQKKNKKIGILRVGALVIVGVLDAFAFFGMVLLLTFLGEDESDMLVALVLGLVIPAALYMVLGCFLIASYIILAVKIHKEKKEDQAQLPPQPTSLDMFDDL